MIAALPAPVLSVAPDVLRELDGREAVSRLWTLFTKCKGSLENGRRLENISWRLWYRDLLGSSPAWQHQREHPVPEKPDLLSEKPYHPPTPIETAVPADADVSDLQLSQSAGAYICTVAGLMLILFYPTGSVHRKTKRHLPVGRIICDMLPSPLSPPLLPTGSPSFASISITASTGFTFISRSPRSEPFAQSQPRLSPSGVPLLPLLPLLPLPEQIVTVEPQFTSPSQLPTPGVEVDESAPFGLKSQQPPILLSTTPVTALLCPEPDPLASASNTPAINQVTPIVATPPKLIVVNPTPGPTPHPTPPASPLSFLSADPGKPQSHGQFLAPPSISRRAPSNQLAPIPAPIPAPVFDRRVLTDVVDVSGEPPIVVDESAFATLRSRSAIHDIPVTAHTAPHLSSETRADEFNNNVPSSSSISRSRSTPPPTSQDPTCVERRHSAEDVDEEGATSQQQPSGSSSSSQHPHRLSLSSTTSTTSTTGTNTSDTSSSQISLGATSVNTDDDDSCSSGGADIKEARDGNFGFNLLVSQGVRPPHQAVTVMMGPGASSSKNMEENNNNNNPIVASPSPISPTMAALQQEQQQALSTSVNSVRSSKSAKSVVSNPGRSTRNGKQSAPGPIRRASSGNTASAGGRSRRAVVGGVGGGNHRASSDASRSRSREAGKGVAAAAGALAAAMGMAMTGGGGGSGGGGAGRKKLGGGSGKTRVTEDDDDGEEVEEVVEGEDLAGKQASAPPAAVAAAAANPEKKLTEAPQTRAKFKFGSVSDDGSAAAAKSIGSGTEISSRAPGSVVIANHMVDPNSTVRQGAVNQVDRKGKGREVDLPQVQEQLAEVENRKTVDKQKQRKEAEAVARARAQESLGAPLLPQQGKRTILLTSESDYTDTDEESWESEDVSEEKDVKAEPSKPPPPQPTSRQASHTEVPQAAPPTQQHPPAPQRPQLNRTQSNASAHHRPTRREMQHIQQRREAQLRVQRAAAQLQKEEEERQRQKDMFAKRPTASFQNLANARTQSFGLLTQLMNPDPAIFPPNHPYRRGHSSGEIQRNSSLFNNLNPGSKLHHSNHSNRKRASSSSSNNPIPLLHSNSNNNNSVNHVHLHHCSKDHSSSHLHSVLLRILRYLRALSGNDGHLQILPLPWPFAACED
ncbi:hypothetical protein EST38_g14485 [Candolleomyces aberdarensis]|uniref:Nitrogen regulatory protein areA GATA-like domain-containing protein n=1 Tax=Candolleomyces aberdarensis TaxID=2316362 RepID=A0A4Q2CX54_9AGAR|nr:hypothetical protein EST38_g14485 [Candolleomyces aberdarensis]